MVEKIIFWVIVFVVLLARELHWREIENQIPPIEKNKEKANPNIAQYVIGFAALIFYILYVLGVIKIKIFYRTDILLTIITVIIIVAIIISTAKDINSRDRRY